MIANDMNTAILTSEGEVVSCGKFVLVLVVSACGGDGGGDCGDERAVEVLATMDFYTTLGTGKIGGLLYQDTVTDCGITSPASFSSYGQRVPATSSDYTWRVIPSAFTAGQTDNETYARASVNVSR